MVSLAQGISMCRVSVVAGFILCRLLLLKKSVICLLMPGNLLNTSEMVVFSSWKQVSIITFWNKNVSVVDNYSNKVCRVDVDSN